MTSHHQKVSDKYLVDVANTDKLIDQLEAIFKRRRDFTDKILGIVDNMLVDVKQSKCARVRTEILTAKGS